MSKVKVRVVLACSLMLVATACADRAGSGESPIAEVAPARSEPITPRGLQQTQGRRLDADNTSEALSHYTAQQQRQVLEFYGRFGDSVFRFVRREQLDWMIDRHYPMPDDILEAAILDDQQLKGRSDAGDIVAASLYYDRLLADIAEAAKQGDPSHRAQERLELERRLLASGSPFAGYLLAHGARVTGAGLASELAAYAWAGHSGDWRAFEEALRVARAADDAEASALGLVEFSVLLKSSSPWLRGSRQGIVIPFPHDVPDPGR